MSENKHEIDTNFAGRLISYVLEFLEPMTGLFPSQVLLSGLPVQPAISGLSFSQD